MRIAIATAFSFFTLMMAVPFAASADCGAPRSEAELQNLLLENSPFKGKWRLRSYSGPTSFSFGRVAGITYVEWESSDERGNMGPASSYMLSFPARNEIAFDSAKSGEIRLKLKEDCRLSGTQDHPNGTVAIETNSASGAGERQPESAPVEFTSTDQLVAALKSGSPFNGSWKWGSRSGRGQTRFHDEGGVFSVTDDDGLTLPVEILSPSRLRYRLPGDRGTVTLEMQDDGSLRGVQSYEGNFAVLTASTPTRSD